MIDRKLLETQITDLKRQQKESMELFQQTVGALALAEYLLTFLPKDSLTLDEFKDAIGAKEATIEEVK